MLIPVNLISFSQRIFEMAVHLDLQPFEKYLNGTEIYSADRG